MNPLEPWRETVAPPLERTMKLELRPAGWKARMWRAFDDSVTPFLRLDVPLNLADVTDRNLRSVLTPFQPVLRNLDVYLERGAGAPLPLRWAVGWLTFDSQRAVAFLHRVLDDPFGNMLASLFRSPEARSDLTLSLALYEAARDKITFAVRDYDIGTGADFRR